MLGQFFQLRLSESDTGRVPMSAHLPYLYIIMLSVISTALQLGMPVPPLDDMGYFNCTRCLEKLASKLLAAVPCATLINNEFAMTDLY